MSNLQAAIGCAQMERISSLIARKREILKTYQQALTCLPGLQMNPEPENTVNGAWMPTVVFAEGMQVSREKLIASFAHENIDARVFFWPISSLDVFESLPGNVNSWSFPGRAINLPSYHDIRSEDLQRVAEVIRSSIIRFD